MANSDAHAYVGLHAASVLAPIIDTRTIVSLSLVDHFSMYLKKTDLGLSLLGGRIDYSLGIVGGLRQTIEQDHEITIGKISLNGIYPQILNGVAYTNINLLAEVSSIRRGRKNLSTLVKYGCEEVCAMPRSHVRTQDVFRAAIDYYTRREGIHIPAHALHHFLLKHRRVSPRTKESTITSAVIQAPDGRTLMLEVPYQNSSTYSLAGGKVHAGEHLVDATIRELAFKTETPVYGLTPANHRDPPGIQLIGIFGVYVHEIATDQFVTNFCAYGRVSDPAIIPLMVDPTIRSKVIARRWFSQDDIRALRKQRLRSRADARFVLGELNQELIQLAKLADTEVTLRHADRIPDHTKKGWRRYLLPLDCVAPLL